MTKFKKAAAIIIMTAIVFCMAASVGSYAICLGNFENTEGINILSAHLSKLRVILEKLNIRLPDIILPSDNSENGDGTNGGTNDDEALNAPDKEDNKEEIKEDNKEDIKEDNNEEVNEENKEEGVKNDSESSAVASVGTFEREVVRLVNEIRARYGLSGLSINEELCNLARRKSQDMCDLDYFSHTSPTYGSAFDMMKRAGISYRHAGENIAVGYSTPSSVVDAWMNSEGHRANILSDNYSQIGVGFVQEGNYWTQMFIG